MRQFPKTQIRTFQFDSFFIENVKKVQDTKRMNLLPNEAYWLYHSEGKLHEFVKRATIDTKLAILAKLDVNYTLTVYDDGCGTDLPKWMEIFRAAKGGESSKEYFDNYVHYSHSFIIGDIEVKRRLSALEVLFHSRNMPISRYIKRIHSYKKLKQYDDLLREQDFIYFMVTVMMSYARVSANDNSYGLDKKEMAILLILYRNHTPMTSDKVKEFIDNLTPSYKTTGALDKLAKQGLINKISHPDNRGKPIKKFTYMVNSEGTSVVNKICLQVLQYL